MKMKFKTKWTNPAQMLMSVVQIVNLTSPFLPPKGQIIAGATLSVAQVILHAMQAVKNPDGTPAETPFDPNHFILSPTNPDRCGTCNQTQRED
jgi:hypothetical protein